ncbi:histidine kinase [Shewanella sairae]|uniref:Histidine kinase n=1 Tax=Shewanella sairae TaxID=190310 RepID=A0ABQ4P4J7_9GAMM|nr:HDOD domain-containing protein [Shewanella sairae]MCL1129789.1 HDOD domain-containing protein [Shewanella sairae]GIU42408.1 histidine kinase [Shewanella sairae]
MAISVAGGVKPAQIIEIEQRLQKLLIIGRDKAVVVTDDFNSGLEEAANKLEVERQAMRARLAKQNEAKAIVDTVSAQLLASVNANIEHHLSCPEQVLAHSKLNEKQVSLLEQLSAEQVDLTRIRPMVEALPWLVRDLVNMLNSSTFRHRRPQSSEVQVTDVKLVLNYIGIENLQTLIPYFCLRNLMPCAQTQLHWTSRKLWRYSVMAAIAAKTLASLHERDSAFIYTCSLMSQLGTTSVIQQSARIFEEMWRNWLKEASASGDKSLYDAVLATEFPAKDVYKQIVTHSLKLNWQLLGLLHFEQSRLTTTFQAIETKLKYAELDPDTAIIERANCYAKVFLLKETGNITVAESRLMFDYYQVTEQELLKLSKQNLNKLPLF